MGKNDIRSNAQAEQSDAELKAWEALSRYKFWMFGYHAAQWVLLNRVSNARRANPFRELVYMARNHLKSIK